MSTFRKGKSYSKIASISQIFSDATDSHHVSLESAVWNEAIDKMKLAIKGLQASNETSSNGCLSANEVLLMLKQYHALHEVAIRYVILAPERWKEWKESIISLLWTERIDDPLSFRSRAEAVNSEDAVKKEQQELLTQYNSHYLVHFWGSHAAFKMRLCELMHLGEIQKTTIDTDTCWHSLAPLFSRLCSDSKHLYLDFPLVGKAEREILEALLIDDESRMELEIRRSFKRDFSVPCCALESEALLLEYVDFEVDEKKEKELRNIFEATARSSAQLKFSSFSRVAYRNTRSSTEDNLIFSLRDRPLECDDLNEEVSRLADALVQHWRESAENCYTALGFTMHRIIDLEVFPSVVNPARFLFLLHLLQKWWVKYSGQTHRWGSNSPYSTEDDSDVWKFLIERHEALFRWAVRTEESQKVQFKDRFAAKLELLEAVSQSLLHCLCVGLANLRHAIMTPEKLELRSQTAFLSCLRWINDYAVEVVSVALMNDIYRYAESVVPEGEVSSNEAECLTENDVVLSFEAKLKVVLLDCFVFFSNTSPQVLKTNQSRLLIILEAVLDHLEASKRSADVIVLKPLWFSAFQLLQRSPSFLPPFFVDERKSLVTYVQGVSRSFQRSIRFAGDVLRDPEAVDLAKGAWSVFCAHTTPSSGKSVKRSNATESGLTISSPFSLLDLPSTYLSRLESGGVSGKGRSIVELGAMDALLEKRKILKRIREEE